MTSSNVPTRKIIHSTNKYEFCKTDKAIQELWTTLMITQYIFFHSFISTRNSKAMSFEETLTTSILFTSIMLSSYICYFHLEVGFKAKKSSFPMWWSISCFASNALVPWNRSTKIMLSWVIWRTTKYQHPRGFF